MSALDNFERMLAQGKDSALLRFSLGNEYLKADNPCNAIIHLREAVRQDPGHSASWKLLGRALNETGEVDAALVAYEQGIEHAQARGDLQAVKEMQVFARRITKRQQAHPETTGREG
jgi:predicted Zn-dependent protease